MLHFYVYGRNRDESEFYQIRTLTKFQKKILVEAIDKAIQECNLREVNWNNKDMSYIATEYKIIKKSIIKY